MKTNINDFDEQSCNLFHPIEIFREIYRLTNGNPCTTVCAWFDNGNCPGYKKLHQKIYTVKAPMYTNAEIAKELVCSTRQIAKRRKSGTLPKKYM